MLVEQVDVGRKGECTCGAGGLERVLEGSPQGLPFRAAAIELALRKEMLGGPSPWLDARSHAACSHTLSAKCNITLARQQAWCSFACGRNERD